MQSYKYLSDKNLIMQGNVALIFTVAVIGRSDYPADESCQTF